MADDDRRSVGVRVRPNSHDFIRLLRQDLSKKNYTFYVDVKANTNPATRDVREWANGALKKIHAAVPISANTGPASRDMADWRRRQAGIKTTVNVNADMSQANHDVEVWRKYAGRDLEIRVKASGGTRGIENARRAAGKDIKVRLDADASHLRKQVSDAVEQPGLFEVEMGVGTKKAKTKVREFFEDVQGQQAELDLGIDVEGARAKADAFRRSEGGKKVTNQLDIDTKKARLELLLLKVEAERRKISVKVDVKTSQLDNFINKFRTIEKQTGSFSLIRSLDFGPFNLGKPTGLLGTVTTITTLAGLLPGLVTGLGAASDAIVRLGGAASIAPGAIGALAASLAVLAVGTSGVSDTFGAMFDMWNEGATDQAAGVSGLVSAHNSYRNAVVDEAKAQQRVADARREALGDLRDLNNELRGGVLNEAQALLDLQKAKDRYAQGDFDNQTDRLQGLLDIQKAELAVDQTREGNIDLQYRANDAQAKGVEHSDKVTDALEAQTRAAQATASALDSITAANGGASSATQKYNDMLSNLSPNARDFIETFAGLKGQVQGFRNEIQDALFEGSGPAFAKMFDNLMPVIGPGAHQIASAMNQVMNTAFETLQTPQGQSIIERILGGTANTQQAISRLINPLINGVGTLVAAGSEHLPQLIDLFNQFATRFTMFIEEADKNGSLDKFMDEGIDALGDVVDIGINATKIINDFSTAFRGAFGEDLLSMISRITGEWHEFLSSQEGQDKLNGYMQQAKDIWADWKPVLEDLPGIFESVSSAARQVLDYMLPTLNLVTEALEHMPWLVEAFAGVWLASKMLSAVSTIKTLASTIASMLSSATKLIPQLAGLANSTLPNPGVIGTPPPGTPGVAPGAPGAKPGVPGTIAAPGTGGSGLGQALKSGAATTGVLTGVTMAVDALITGKQQADQEKASVDPLNAQLPQGFKPIVGNDIDITWVRAVEEMAKTDPALKWVMEASSADQVERAKRYLFATKAVSAPGYDPATWAPPVAGSYMTGGYTDWGRTTGKTAELHGNEYIQPSPVVDHYGVNAMKAVHEKRAQIIVPKFDGGGQMVYDPATGTWVQSGAAISHGQNPGAGPGILNSVVQGAASGFSNVASTLGQAAPAASPGAPTAGGGFGDVFSNSLLSGLGLPVPGASQGATGPSWPGGGNAPVGLGGGADGFDIRQFGIGPGPVGSGPADWMQFAGEELGNFGSSFISAIGEGILGGLGLGGVMANIQAGGGILGHFLGGSGNGKAQGPGAAQTNADVSSLLAAEAAMGSNPAYPGVPNLPNVFDASTGSAVGAKGLQTNTARGQGIIEKFFPWSQGHIGGVRPDALKWHPSGLALDVMTDPGHENNDPPSPDGLAKGNALYAWLNANKDKLGIDYLMWGPVTGDADHYNHVHVNFAASGFGPGNGPMASVTPPAGAPATPKNAWAATPPGTKTYPALTKTGQPSTAALRGLPTHPGSDPNPPAAPKPAPGGTMPSTGNPALDKLLLPAGSHEVGGYIPMANPNGPRFDPKFPGTDRRSGEAWVFPDGTVKPIPAPWGTPGPGQITLPGLHAGIGAGIENRWAQGGGGPGKLPGLGQGGFDRIPRMHKVMDRGGWIGPGTTVVHNYTNKPELISSFATGGLNTGTVPYRPLPPVPDARKMQPQPVQPKPSVPAIVPQAPPMVNPPHVGTGMPPGPGNPPAAQGPSGAATAAPNRPATGTDPKGKPGIHTLPALSTGITSGFAAAGKVAGAAASMGMGGMGGGAMGGLVEGLFGQAGKIANNVANVASSFLVGNITGGTTENPYGVTQRGNVPTGGTQVMDASNNQYGDVYTNNLEEYMKIQDRRNAQRSQSSLGRWGQQV